VSLTPLIRKLESSWIISDDEREVLKSLPIRVSDIRADQDIVREGDRPSRCFIVLEGVTCTYKLARDGKRQIVNFHIPGDAPDLQSIYLRVLDFSIGTITPCKIGFIEHEAVKAMCVRFPRIAAAFWRETLVDAAIFREWMTSIGQRPAYSRIAHLFCEMALRFRAIGLAEGHSIPFPITQREIGDALGISDVHVNRSLQALRRKGLVSLKNGTLEILNWEGLQRDGDFDPAYLHLNEEQMALDGRTSYPRWPVVPDGPLLTGGLSIGSASTGQKDS
jgi:CRP-like cAMP-binding protein